MNFDSYSQIYLQVDGTLIAKGTSREKIYFNGENSSLYQTALITMS